MTSRFYLVIAPPGLEPSGSAYAASGAQEFDQLSDAILAGQAQSDVRHVPWISHENLIFTPDHIRVILKNILTDVKREWRDADRT